MKELGLYASFALAAVAVDAKAQPQAVALADLPDHVTEARIEIDAPPSEVYALVTNYANWPAVFSDITKVNVESGGREDARVRFRSRALGHTVTVVFANAPGRAVSFRGVEGPPGGRAHGDYTFEPLDGGTRTAVTAKLYMDVKGAPSWFVSDSKIRDMRRTKLRADFEDVARHFAGRRPVTSQRG